MAIQWGAYETAPSGGGTSGMRVGIDVTNTAVSSSSTSVTFTFKIYTQNYLAYSGDSQGLSYGGTAGSHSDTTFSNSSGTGSVVLRATKTYTYTYSSSSYGTSPGTRTFSATSFGAFDGTTASKTVTVTIPARPYTAANAPTNVAATRNSDTKATVSWTRNPTSQKPYTSLTVQMRTYTGAAWSAYTTVATTSATANSYVKTGLTSNRAYQFQVRANNANGSSAWVTTSNIYMTPSEPSNGLAKLNASGTSVTVTWTNTHYSSVLNLLTVERSVNGGAYTVVASGLAYNVVSWADSSPGAGTNTYRIKSVNGSLSSGYENTNTVGTVVAPLAPTNLAPTGVPFDATLPLTLTWTHNPGADNAPQSAFTIETSSNSGSTWQVRANNISSTDSSWTMPGGTLTNGNTYLWRVRTVGITSAGYGPNSATATLTASATPTVVLTQPTSTTTSSTISTAWTYSQANGSPQAVFEVELYEADGVTRLERGIGYVASTSSYFDTLALDGQTYIVKLRVQSAAGLWSDWATVQTTVSLPVPQAVTLSAEYHECSGSMALALTLEAIQSSAVNRTNRLLNPGPDASGNWFSATTGGAVAVTYPDDPLDLSPSGLVAKATWSTAATGNVSIHPTSGSGTSGRPVTAGTTYAIRLTGRTSVAGQTYSMGINWYTSAGALVASSGMVSGLQPAVDTDFTGTAAMAAPATSAYAVPFITQTAGPVMGVGQSLISHSAVFEQASSAGTYFSGSTPDEPTIVYSWSGTTGASQSTATGRSEVAATSVAIDRRAYGDSEWVRLISNLPVPGDFIDTLPSTTGTNEYKVLVASAQPSYRQMPEVLVDGTDGRPGSGFWVFLTYGDAFAKTLRMRGNVRISESAGRSRDRRSYLGRKKPVALFGANTDYEVSVAGDLRWDEFCRDLVDDCTYDSPQSEWITAGLEAEVVCLRDHTGRRMFGQLSDVDGTDVASPGLGAVSFKIGQTEFVEQYGAL